MPAPTTLSRGATAALRAAGVRVREATDDDAIDGIAPALVASPTSTEQVAAVLRTCATHRLAVVARGAGTKITWGTPPAVLDVIVDVSGLDRVVEHAAGDLIVVAEAGVRIAELNDLLGRAGQHLAVDETVPGATVGGTICAAASGPQRFLRGTVRDLLIGLTFVRADGKVVHAGGRVVKNVAGYDVCKLLVGSLGTLGIVTQATFRLHPLPPARRVVTFEFRNETGPSGVQGLVASVLGTQTAPSAIELDWPDGSPATLTVLFEGSTAGVAIRAATIADVVECRTTSSEDLPSWWARYPWTPDRATARDAAVKLTLAISGLREVLAAVDRLRAEYSMAIDVRGAAGVGVLYAALEPLEPPGPSPADAEEAVGEVAAAVDRLRAICTRHGGTVVVLDAPAMLAQGIDPWGPIPALALMRRVKDEFDPDQRLSPGRFVGGI